MILDLLNYIKTKGRGNINKKRKIFAKICKFKAFFIQKIQIHLKMLPSLIIISGI